MISVTRMTHDHHRPSGSMLQRGGGGGGPSLRLFILDLAVVVVDADVV